MTGNIRDSAKDLADAMVVGAKELSNDQAIRLCGLGLERSRNALA